MIRAVIHAAILSCWAGLACAQGFTALARIVPEQSRIEQRSDGLHIGLTLSQGVPFRAYTLEGPARLVLDFREVDFAGVTSTALLGQGADTVLRFGAVRPGWSRLVLDLDTPQVVGNATMSVKNSGEARLDVSLFKVDESTFQAQSGAPRDAQWARYDAKPAAPVRKSKTGVTVVLDPGHGGIDPGAIGPGITEAQLMLILAQEIRDSLVRAGAFDVVLTREADTFVSLERRVQLAREAGADLFISLHADALASGKANGAAVYTLSPEASDEATAALAERHNRTDLLAGVDLSGQDDQVASILLDLARQENTPRSQDLARGIILGINQSVGHTYKRPIQSAGFSVLKAADIPSVLVEVGFLSSKDDMSKLMDPVWRGKMVNGITSGIQAWMLSDANAAELRRK